MNAESLPILFRSLELSAFARESENAQGFRVPIKANGLITIRCQTGRRWPTLLGAWHQPP
jgi:hypothetical protein